jgi:hypothetical protein
MNEYIDLISFTLAVLSGILLDVYLTKKGNDQNKPE